MKILKDNKGMTLIEVLVSIAIFAIVAIPLLGIFSQSAITSANSKIKTKEATIAQTIAENIKAGIVKDNSDLSKVAEIFEEEGFLPYVEQHVTDSGDGLSQYEIRVSKAGSSTPFYTLYVVAPKTAITAYTPVYMPFSGGSKGNVFDRVVNYVLNLIAIIVIAIWTALFILFVVIPAFGLESIIEVPKLVSTVINLINSGVTNLKAVATKAAESARLTIPWWLKWW
ncbi:prepilin-type N-terminal cleavage/methylation domain-containing protein [Thermoanaerobacter uzonensis DSM 18761]|jgi:prepilin-type N-terminal cleavage/methylation domain-containing protein|uniref:Prepilin-type N-terminal cleavage/methylation domain-containing protein n=1 Tax=Thermoanaerobacter uzonensis DSM 18761 TaxID=1123369 RepID=A0A1M4VAA2_9THEO|nr:prepilin-type N-terminal cleavage/methylation domain-containing protein [Thermoanaerobacter uzonensis]SHE65813.1 prepilin-type N-terminal cleavage/methylation domain-containing protein [Thermoanaerobacter uzonensis DSM 18761]